MRAAHHLAETGFIPPSARRRSQIATLPDNPSALEVETVGRRRAMQHVIGPPSGGLQAPYSSVKCTLRSLLLSPRPLLRITDRWVLI